MRRHHAVGIQAFEQITHDGGFAGTHFASDDNEAFATRDSVHQIRTRAAMLLAAEIELGIGIELERLSAQPVESFVHDLETVIDRTRDGRFSVWLRRTGLNAATQLDNRRSARGQSGVHAQ